jgi:pimeloyl-ACP methyl ester carboxylesterase
MNFLMQQVLSIACAGAITAGAAAPPVESPIEAAGPSGALHGTLLAPVGARGPVVLIIPGSGPTDRDGNNPLGIRAATYRLLAADLARRGISSVRIDKRGMFGSAAATADANAVTIADYVSDVHAWIQVIRERTGTTCVWLLGHSEGALVAMVAARTQPDLCGLILVSGAGRPIGEVLRAQLSANPANASVLPAALRAIDALEAGQTVDTAQLPPPLLGLFAARVQGFLISAFSYDPAQLLSGINKPVLIIQGQRDLQVQEADARLLQQADPKATLVLLPEVNHVLKLVPTDDIGSNVATYSDPALPIAPGVGDAIARFLLPAAP